jgi:23S rRNA pseudouridine1911/1915/1917 synthase
VSRSFRGEESDGTLGAALARLGESPNAVADGRVFVERRRAKDVDVPVRAGDEIVVHAAAAAAPAIELLGEWQDLYAVLKPPGLSTEPDRHGGASLLRSTATLLDVPVSVLHAATRLDAAVSGIVVVARGNDAARRVATLQQEGLLSRRYVALALPSRPVEPRRSTWNGAIGKGEKGRPVLGGKDARPASTRYRFLAELTESSLLKAPVALLVLEPLTGRSHQLRVHAAAAGAPLLGDVVRGGPRRLTLSDGRVLPIDRVALHAGLIQVMSGEYVEWSVRAPPAADLITLFGDLGGDPRAFDAALDAPWLDGLAGS